MARKQKRPHAINPAARWTIRSAPNALGAGVSSVQPSVSVEITVEAEEERMNSGPASMGSFGGLLHAFPMDVGIGKQISGRHLKC